MRFDTKLFSLNSLSFWYVSQKIGLPDNTRNNSKCFILIENIVEFFLFSIWKWFLPGRLVKVFYSSHVTYRVLKFLLPGLCSPAAIARHTSIVPMICLCFTHHYLFTGDTQTHVTLILSLLVNASQLLWINQEKIAHKKSDKTSKL